MTSNTPESSGDDRVILGHISAPHGVRGDVLIKTYTQSPEDIAAYKKLHTDNGELTFRRHRVTNKGVVATFVEITDRNQAEALKGTKLWVPRSQLPAPEEDEFYYADLIGLDARLEDGTKLGTITAVQNFGADDLLEIKPDPGWIRSANPEKQKSGKTLLIPFTKANVPLVDIQIGKVTVIPPEELGEETREP